MSAELLPCPFCGGTNIALAAHPHAGRGFDHHGDTIYSIDCMECGASFPNRYRREILVGQWNTRAASPQATATRTFSDEQIAALRVAAEALIERYAAPIRAILANAEQATATQPASGDKP